MVALLPASLRFLGGIAGGLAVMWIPPVALAINSLVASCAGTALSVFAGLNASGSATSSELLLFVDDYTIRISAASHTRNLAVFVAALFAVQPKFWRSMKLPLISGLTLLLVVDGMIVAADAWEQLPATYPHGGLAYEVLAIFAVWHPTGGLFLAPLFLALALGLQSPTDSARSKRYSRGAKKSRRTRK